MAYDTSHLLTVGHAKTIYDNLKSAVENINYNNLKDSIKSTIGISELYSDDLTSQLTTVTGGFYKQGVYTVLSGAKYYKLDCDGIDTILVDKITPGYYDAYTVIDSNGNTLSYKYTPSTSPTERDRVVLDVTKADFVAFSDDSIGHAIKVMGIPHTQYSAPYTVNLADRSTGYETGKYYANGTLGDSQWYRYTEYNVMGLTSVKLVTKTEGWTDVYDLLDKDKDVLNYELVTSGGTYTRTIDVSEACFMRVSTITTNGDAIRLFGAKDYNNNPYAGKQIAVVGDSWVEYNATNTENFIDLVCADLGIGWKNYGLSGTSYKAGEDSSKAYYQRVQTADFDDCDLVVLFGSGNDNTNISLGNLGTASDSTSDTICGCANITIDNILTRYPLIKIAVIAPAPWETMPNTTANNNFEKLAEALEEVANRHGLPYLNLYKESNMRPWDEDFKTEYQPDGVHPNNAGHAYFYGIVRDFVSKIIL